MGLHEVVAMKQREGDMASTLSGAPTEGYVVVPREPTEAMLRAALDARYQRSKRSQRVKTMFPGGYETWLRVGLKEDAPAIAEEYKAMLAANDPAR